MTFTVVYDTNEAKSPDAFVLDQMYINMPAVAASIRQIADSRTSGQKQSRTS